MFGKRKSKEQPQPSVSTPVGVGSLGTVIVPRSALERAQAQDGGSPYELVQAIVDFVNAMTDAGLYSRSEIHPNAMQAFHSDFYLAQVNNGGHSQFIHNCFANLPHVIADVRAGLAAMEAKDHLAIFERMAAWVVQNPGEVSKQTGFEGGRAPLLDELDDLFYAADKAAPMIDLSARWIASWRELRAVDDADYPEAIQRVLMLNPLREARLIMFSIVNLRRQMTDWFQVASGLACANAPDREVKLAVGGGSMMDIEGEQQMAFVMRTNRATRLCAVSKEHAALYEWVEAADNPPMPAMGDVEGMKQAIRDGRLARYKGPTVGKRLSYIRSQMISDVVEQAVECGAPIALDLLLRKAGIDTNSALVSPMSIQQKPTGSVVDWIVVAGGKPLLALTTANGSALLLPGENRELARVTKAEVVEHANRIEAGAIKAP